VKTFALALAAAAALSVPVAPASAALPCRDLTMTIPQCTEPLRDKLQHLCFPPNPDNLYGC